MSPENLPAINPAAAGWIEIQYRREAGASVHELGVAGATLLMEHEVYTTEITRDPGTFRQFQQDRRLEEAHEQIAANANERFAHIPEFREAVAEKRLGSALVDVFASVTKVEAYNVHIRENPDDEPLEEGEIDHRTVVADNTIWTVGEGPDNAATKLSIALGGLLHSYNTQPTVVTESSVLFRELNEHQARSLARIVGALVVQEYREQTVAVTLPREKRSLPHWDEHGETFRPTLREQLERADQRYQSLQKVASYHYPEQLSPVSREDDHLIVNDFAPSFQGIRDIFNGLIHKVRGGSHHNKEQDPDETARPFIEEGIELKRDAVSAEEEWKGPPTSRALTFLEKMAMTGTETLEGVKKRPGRALLRVAGKGVGLAGLGLLDLGLKAAEYSPHTTKAGKQLADDIREWKKRKAAFEADHRRIDMLVERQILDILVNANRPPHEPDEPPSDAT